MEFLHTMIRVGDLDAALRFFCDGLGLREVRRNDYETGRFTLVFLASPDDIARAGWKEGDPVGPGLPCLELTHNWDESEYAGGRNFGHIAWRVADIYAMCAHLAAMGVIINRPPRDGRMAFVRSPDGVSIELLQAGEALEPCEPWASMGNTGSW